MPQIRFSRAWGAQFGNHFGELTHERALRFWRHGIENLQELPHAQGEKWRAKKRKNWLPFFVTHFSPCLRTSIWKAPSNGGSPKVCQPTGEACTELTPIPKECIAPN